MLLKDDVSATTCHHYQMQMKQTIDHFHCTQQNNKLETKKEEEEENERKEAKKMKCYRRLIYKQFVQV